MDNWENFSTIPLYPREGVRGFHIVPLGVLSLSICVLCDNFLHFHINLGSVVRGSQSLPLGAL